MKRTEIYLQQIEKKQKKQHTPFDFVEMKNVILWYMPTWFCMCTKRWQRSLHETRATYLMCRKGKYSLGNNATYITVLYVTFTWITLQCFPLHVKDEIIIRICWNFFYDTWVCLINNLWKVESNTFISTGSAGGLCLGCFVAVNSAREQQKTCM